MNLLINFKKGKDSYVYNIRKIIQVSGSEKKEFTNFEEFILCDSPSCKYTFVGDNIISTTRNEISRITFDKGPTGEFFNAFNDFYNPSK